MSVVTATLCLANAETRDAVRDLLVSLAAWTRRLRSTQESVAS